MKKLLLSLVIVALGLSAFAAPEAESYTITISPSTGNSWKSTGQTANSTWSSQWRSTASANTPQVRISSGLGTGAFFLWQNATTLDIRSAQNANTRWDVSVMDPNYYISEIKCIATRTTAGAPTAYVNGEVIDGTMHTFTYNENELPALVINRGNGNNNNTAIVWTDFTVKVQKRQNKAVRPVESGWYIIQATQDFRANYIGAVAGLNPSGTYEHTNGDYDLTWQEFNGDLSTISPNCFVYVSPIDGDDNHVTMRLPNGHYLHQACMSLRESSPVLITNLTQSALRYEIPAELNEVRIGNYWNSFGDTDDKVGQGTSGSTYNCRFFKVNPESRFDEWTVNILNALHGNEAYADVDQVHIPKLKADAQLQITSADVFGAKKVYDGGKFFVTKGVVPQYDDMVADPNNGNTHPEITIDEDAKTITVDYSKVHGDKSEIVALYNAQLTHMMSEIDAYKGVLSGAEYTEFTADINAVAISDDDTKAQVEDKYAVLLAIDMNAKMLSIYNRINGRLVYVKSLNRPDAPYLTLSGTAVGSASANTVAAPVERSVWMLWKHGTDNNFYLFSPTLNCYLNNNSANVNMSQGSAATRYTLALHQSVSNAVSICTNAAASAYLAAVSGTENATFVAADNETTAWEIKLAAVPADQLNENKVYTLRSSMSVHTQNGTYTRANGTLLGVGQNLLENPAVVDGCGVTLTKDEGINQLWTVQVDGNGRYRVCNLVSEGITDNYCLAIDNSGKKIDSSNASFEIKPAVDIEGYTFGDPGAVVLVAEDGSFIASDGNSSTFTDVNSGSDNQAASSCVYYFHEVSNAEALVEAYKTAVATQLPQRKESLVQEIDKFTTNASVLWSEDDSQIAKDAIASIATADSYASVAEANSAVREVYAPYYDFYMTAAGKDVQFRNKMHTTRYMAYDGTNAYASNLTDATNLGTIWTLVADEANHGFKLQNYLTGTQCSNTNSSTNNVKMDLVENGHTFDLEINSTTANNVLQTGLLIRARDNYSERYYYHMASTADYAMVKWSNSLASMFVVELADELASEEVKVSAEYSEGVHHLVFSHASANLTKHPAYHESHVVTLVKQEPMVFDAESSVEPTVTVAHADIIEDGDNLRVNLNQKLDAGEYSVMVPKGYFKVGTDKLSAPITASVAVDEEGKVTTGFAEISASKYEAIYDLQGRKLAQPAKGINIIGGRKVLVK